MIEMDCTTWTWREMSEVVLAICREAKRRNPIGINFYVPVLWEASERLREISGAEAVNFTCEYGPIEPKRRKQK